MDPFDQQAINYVQRVLRERGLTPTALAELAGLSQTTVTRPLNAPGGKYRLTEKTIRKISDATGIPFLIDDHQPLPASNALPDYSATEQRDAKNLAPIFASAQGGSGEQTLASGDIVEYRPKPQRWSRVRGLYGFYVIGDSMEPRIRPGEMVWVHPHRRPSIGEEGVFAQRVEDGGEQRIMVKLLTGETQKQFTVKQYNPARDFELKKTEWDCQLIVDIDLNKG